MASVRGLTVEISADATKFNNEMKTLRASAKSSQSELSALQKSLKLEYNEETLKKAQKVAQEALDKTSQNAEKLRERLSSLEKSGNVDTADYEKLQAELAQTEAKATELKQTIKELNNTKLEHLASQIENVGTKVENVGKALTPVSAAASAAVAGLAALGLSAVSTADNVATLAVQYDTTATAIQRMNYVALQTDVDAENMYKALTKVRAGLSDIATETSSTAAVALQQLGVDFASFDGTEEQFYAIVSALSDMDDKTQMVAIANDIFGDKLANELLPMIYAGTDAINEYCDEYEELGALTDEQTSALAEFDNVMNKIKTQLSNVAAQIGASLLPIMEEIAGIISDVIVPKLQALADWFNSLSLSQQEFALSALLVVAALAPLAVGIGKIITLAGNVIKIIPKISAALSTLAAHPIILIIGVIAAILVVLYTRCEAFREAINNIISTLTDALSPIMDTITTTLSKIIEFLSPIIEMIGDSLAAALNDVMQILSPLFDVVSFIFELLEPLLSVALLPLQVALTALSVPLQLLGSLLNWLAPLFTMFGNIVRGVFEAVIEIVNYVLGFVEDAINWVIRMINGLIDGVNAALGVLGVSIGHISEVSLRINTGDLAEIEDVALDTTAPDNVYEDKDTSIYNGDTYNYDYSTSTKTQNVTVTIENYASEMDVDDLVQQINIKLAEAM